MEPDGAAAKVGKMLTMFPHSNTTGGFHPLDRSSHLTDLVYAPIHDRQKLDLHLSDMSGSPMPLLIWIHGGAWLGGDKSEIPLAVTQLQSRWRVALASVGYRLSEHAIWPAQLADVMAALHWLRANARKYNLDTERVFVMGHSAGGHLAAMLGTIGMGAERVSGVVDLSGPTNISSFEEDDELCGCPYEDNHFCPFCPETLLLGCSPPACPELAQYASPVRSHHNHLLLTPHPSPLTPHPSLLTTHRLLPPTDC